MIMDLLLMPRQQRGIVDVERKDETQRMMVSTTSATTTTCCIRMVSPPCSGSDPPPAAAAPEAGSGADSCPRPPRRRRGGASLPTSAVVDDAISWFMDWAGWATGRLDLARLTTARPCIYATRYCRYVKSTAGECSFEAKSNVRSNHKITSYHTPTCRSTFHL